MHPPEKHRERCQCDIAASSAAKPDICMECDGKI